MLPALALLSSCVSDISAVKDMRTDINELRQDSYQSRRDLEELKKAMKGPAGKEGASQESLEAIRKGQESLFSQVSDTQREVQLLNGKLEETAFQLEKRLQQASADIAALKSRAGAGGQAVPEDLRARIESIEAEMGRLKAQVEALGGGGAAKEAPQARQKEPSGPDRAYEEAYAVFKAKRYEEARKKMEEFIKKYPDHKLAGNAQFWIAETYFAEKDYDDAILAYEEVLQKYKGTQKAPAALLRQANAFRELGDKKAARGILKELIAKYPDSEQAKAAKEDLKAISE
jgi:tol-pal system protein YbgF